MSFWINGQMKVLKLVTLMVMHVNMVYGGEYGYTSVLVIVLLIMLTQMVITRFRKSETNFANIWYSINLDI